MIAITVPKPGGRSPTCSSSSSPSSGGTCSAEDSRTTGTLMAAPHPACAVPMMTAQAFFSTQQILTHLIWGGTFERFPGLQLVMTEQGSGWVISALASMDYTYEKSYLRRDVRDRHVGERELAARAVLRELRPDPRDHRHGRVPGDDAARLQREADLRHDRGRRI